MKKEIYVALATALILVAICLVVSGCLQGQGSETTANLPPETTETTAAPADSTTETTTAPTEPTTETTTAPAESTTAPTSSATTAPSEPLIISLNADAAFVYDLTAQTFLYTKGEPEQSLAPASITKLFTAYVALQILSPEQEITIGRELDLVDIHSSFAGLAVGDRLTVRQLVAGMLLPSGNDASYTLAVAAGRAIAGNSGLGAQQAVSVFMDEVNAVAAAHQLVNTCFLTPDGNDQQGHHTCLADLVTIMQLVMEEPIIVEYAGMAALTFTAPDGKEFTWKNSNLLLHEDSQYYHSQALGGKTGSTSTAGKCLLSWFAQEDRILLICVMGCSTSQSRYEDTLLLYSCFAD